jgi:hypothetical protein
MKRVDAKLVYFFSESRRFDAAFDCSASNSGSCGNNLHLDDHRVADFLVLLKRLDRSVGGLSVVPTPELREIVSSAIQLSGFLDPVEARVLIVSVLKAIEMRELVLEVPWIPPPPVLAD